MVPTLAENKFTELRTERALSLSLCGQPVEGKNATVRAGEFSISDA